MIIDEPVIDLGEFLPPETYRTFTPEELAAEECRRKIFMAGRQLGKTGAAIEFWRRMYARGIEETPAAQVAAGRYPSYFNRIVTSNPRQQGGRSHQEYEIRTTRNFITLPTP